MQIKIIKMYGSFFPLDFILMKISFTLLSWHHKNNANMSAKSKFNVKIIARKIRVTI